MGTLENTLALAIHAGRDFHHALDRTRTSGLPKTFKLLERSLLLTVQE